MPQHSLGDLTQETLQFEAEIFEIEDLSSPAADLVDAPVPGGGTGECNGTLCGTPEQSGGASGSGSGSSIF